MSTFVDPATGQETPILVQSITLRDALYLNNGLTLQRSDVELVKTKEKLEAEQEP